MKRSTIQEKEFLGYSLRKIWKRQEGYSFLFAKGGGNYWLDLPELSLKDISHLERRFVFEEDDLANLKFSEITKFAKVSRKTDLF